MTRTMSSRKICSKCGNPGECRKGKNQCKRCTSERQHQRRIADLPETLRKERSRREANREQNTQRSVLSNHRRRARWQEKIDQIKGTPCRDCGRTFPSYVMDFDHRDPEIKIANINLLVGKAVPWVRLQEELDKCDVVCVCCHRMRTWRPLRSRPKSRKQLIQTLKRIPCKDCGGTFHYCQMDFDHVRGEKKGNVASIGSTSALLEEAAKCDVVCANCHRIRTQNKLREHRRISPQPRAAKIVPVPRPWHALAGTTTDAALARRFEIHPSNVVVYRKRLGIAPFRFAPSDEDGDSQCRVTTVLA